MSFLSRDWLLEKNTYGNTSPAEYRAYAQKLIESAPIYSSVDEETNKRLHEIEAFICDINIEEIDDIGIGAAGQVNRENGIIINAPNIDCSNLNINHNRYTWSDQWKWFRLHS